MTPPPLQRGVWGQLASSPWAWQTVSHRTYFQCGKWCWRWRGGWWSQGWWPGGWWAGRWTAWGRLAAEWQLPYGKVTSWDPTGRRVDCGELVWIAKARRTPGCWSRLFASKCQCCYCTDCGHCRFPLSAADTDVLVWVLWYNSDRFPPNSPDRATVERHKNIDSQYFVKKMFKGYWEKK